MRRENLRASIIFETASNLWKCPITSENVCHIWENDSTSANVNHLWKNQPPLITTHLLWKRFHLWNRPSFLKMTHQLWKKFAISEKRSPSLKPLSPLTMSTPFENIHYPRKFRPILKTTAFSNWSFHLKKSNKKTKQNLFSCVNVFFLSCNH